MARLVLDTNSLLQSISRRSRYHDLWPNDIDKGKEPVTAQELQVTVHIRSFSFAAAKLRHKNESAKACGPGGCRLSNY